MVTTSCAAPPDSRGASAAVATRQPAVELAHVSFRHKGAAEGALSLDDVSLVVPAGQVVVLCGRSGCGKTTVTRLVNGLIPQFYEGDLWGHARAGGLDPSEAPVTDTAALVGSVFQNPRSQFFNVDSTSELAFCCENMGWDVDLIDAAVGQVVERFGIENLLDRSLFKLSGGEKQKIACASVSAHDPQVLVLDEPASNLDIPSIHMLTCIIKGWKAEGRTVLVAEHRLGYLMDVADRFVLIEDGHVARDLTADEMRAVADEDLHAWGLRSWRLRFGEGVARQLPSGGQAAEAAGVDIRSLSFSYGRAVERPDVQVAGLAYPHGAVVGIVGTNGAGKSTFARCLCGLEKRCADEVLLGGRPRKASERRRLCYLVMQDVNHQLFTESVREEVALSLWNRLCDPLSGEAAEAEIDRVLAGLGLLEYADAHPMALSGGQKQRVAIASAVASGCEVCVFDEPTSGLDWAHMQDTARNVRRLAERGVTSFIITHDPELVMECCSHVLVMNEGRVVCSGHMHDAAVMGRLAELFG